MSAINDLANIQKIANAVGFKRSGQEDGYLNFVKEQAVKEQQQIDSIVSEANETLRKINQEERLIAVREERRRLQTQETPEVYDSIPRVTPSDLSNLTDEQVTQKLKDAFNLFRSRVEISKADFTLLVNFLEQNNLDCTDASVIERALQFIIDRLTLIQDGGPIPQPGVVTPVVQEEKNPFPESSHPQSAHSIWNMEHLQERQYAEVMPVVRAALEEIVKNDTRDLSAENIEKFILIMRNKNIPFTRSSVRQQFYRLWAKEMSDDGRRAAFTAEEIYQYENEIEDSKLSSREIREKYRPRF